jgi:tRNA(Glu) U13 pseudouridine synthase TruD
LIHAAEPEKAVGIGYYATDGSPCHARAKSSDGDFRVEEYIDSKELSVDEKPGYYPIYKVQKHSIDTMHMARQLSEILGSRVSYGG